MIHDLFLKNSSAVLLGIAKIDISNDTENIGQKQVSVNDISFNPAVGDQEEASAIIEQQNKIERFVQPRNFLMQDLLDQLTEIEVVAEFEGELLNTLPSPTTTTTTAG